jgi:phage/conjugal plasmid C-4 type zinc finger TraR family protein
MQLSHPSAMIALKATYPETTALERYADDLDLAQSRIDQVTELAIAEIRKGSSLPTGRQYCLDCGHRIPVQRLAHVPNAARCAPCQERQERHRTAYSGN